MAQYTNWPAPEQLTLLLLSAAIIVAVAVVVVAFGCLKLHATISGPKVTAATITTTQSEDTQRYTIHIYIYTLCIVSVFGAYKYRSNLSLGRKRWAVLPALLCRRLWRPAGNCPGTPPTGSAARA